MTLQMLEYFIALAEYGSFTDAAGACFVSQPALSRAIASWDNELDCELVYRDKRKKLTFTPAGETLLVEARRVFQQMETLRERVQTAQREACAGITMGYIAYGLLRTFRSAVSPLLERMRQENLRLTPVYGAAPEIKERVLSGELDCALLPESCTLDMNGCRRTGVCTSEFRVMIPKEHPLFGISSVTIEQLKDSKFVFFDPKDLPETLATHLSICREAGFSPRIVGYGKKIGDVTDLLHQHGAVGMASAAFEYAESDDMSFVPIRGKKYGYRLVLIMREKPVNPAMECVFDWLQERA